MKKISFFLALAAVAMGFTACDSPTDPVLNTENLEMTLNAPAYATSGLELVKGETFTLDAVQPNYGYAAPATYALQVSLTEDFAAYETLSPLDAGLAQMEFNDNDLAVALCKLLGFNQNTYTDQGEFPVYVRATAEVAGVEGSYAESNIVKLERVSTYFATDQARKLYMVSNLNGWVAPELANEAKFADYTLDETGVDTGVFTGTFTMKGGDAFRFYTTLTGWGENNQLPSFGATGENDNNVTVAFTKKQYEGDAVAGKGNWVIPADFDESSVLVTVDLNAETITLKVGARDYSKFPAIYLVGKPAGNWITPDAENAAKYADYKLYDLEGNGVYVSVAPVELKKGDAFRFYKDLTGWGEDGELPSMGPAAKDGDNTKFTLTNDEWTGSWVPGKGSWVADADMTISIAVDMTAGAEKVTFSTYVDEEEE